MITAALVAALFSVLLAPTSVSAAGGFRVSGTVASTSGAPEIWVTLVASSGRTAVDSLFSGGTFSFGAVSAGSYTLVATAAGGYSEQALTVGATTSDIKLTVSPAPSYSVVGTLANYRDLASVAYLFVKRADASNPAGVWAAAGTVNDRSGSFALALSAGAYAIAAAPLQDISDTSSALEAVYLTGQSVTDPGVGLYSVTGNQRVEVVLPRRDGSPAASVPGKVVVSSKRTTYLSLRAKTSDWYPASVGFTYQWLRNGTAIPGATGSTYDTTLADARTTLSVDVMGSRAGFADSASTSAGTAIPTMRGLFSPRFSLSGRSKVGKTLTVKVTGTPMKTRISYRWYVGGKPVRKGTKHSLTVTASMKGKRIVAEITLRKSGFKSLVRTLPTRKVT